MPKQLCLSAVIDLSEDVFAASQIVTRVGEPWQKLLAELKEAGVKHTHTSETIETRAKAASPGRPRGSRRTTVAATTNGSAPAAEAESAL